MNKRLATKWVKALRSGEYKQGQHQLRNRPWVWEYDDYGDAIDGSPKGGEVQHCCLGVLYEVVTEKQAPKRGLLPKSVLAQCGMSPDGQEKLVMFNDDRQWSFKKIANWVEKNYQKLRA